MKKILSVAALSAFFLCGLALADQSWTGKISDSMCGRSHKAAMEHGSKKMTDAECVKACIDKGAKYVLVVGGKIYEVSNQDYAGLAEHAGHEVKVTGEKTGDSIKVTGIDAVEKGKKAM